MARKPNQQNLDHLVEAIQSNPGQRAGWIARHLGRDNKGVLRDLPKLEDRGDLLTEDDKGRLSWFGRCKKR